MRAGTVYIYADMSMASGNEDHKGDEDTYDKLLKKWDLSQYIKNFENDGWIDPQDWDGLIQDNGKPLKDENLIDKGGFRKKFIRCYEEWKNDKMKDLDKDSYAKPLVNSKVITMDYNGIKRNSGFYLIPSIMSCSNKEGNKDAYNNFILQDRILSDNRHKVVLMVGQTGAGKTTTVNSMINYLYDVKYKNPFRYKLILEKTKKTGQAESQTDFVTSYQLKNYGANNNNNNNNNNEKKSEFKEKDNNSYCVLSPTAVDYDLTIVDTPGFGDTRGVEQDKKIMGDIKLWFEKKLDTLDAVCFVIKSTDSRLTSSQKYVFESILNIFGEDIKNNIFIVITSCDAADPPALDALKAGKIPYAKCFRLNNSAYFQDPTIVNSARQNMINEQYWDGGSEAFKDFFNELSHTPPASLTLTKDVLNTRELLVIKINYLQELLKEALQGIEEIKKQKKILEENKKSGKEKYQLFLTSYIWVKIETSYKFHTTCTNKDCIFKNNNRTCHFNCWSPFKFLCCVMKNGKCNICGCDAKYHENKSFYWKKKETKHTIDLRKEVETAQENVVDAHDTMVDVLVQKIKRKEKIACKCVKVITKSINKLRKIALNKNVLSCKDCIVEMIEKERDESRKKSLKQINKQMKTIENIENDKIDFQKLINDARNEATR